MNLDDAARSDGVEPESGPATQRYRLAAGIEFAAVGSERAVFRSDSVRVELAGRSTVDFVARVVPLLSPDRSVAEVARRLGDVDVADLATHLGELQRAGVLSLEPSEGSRSSATTLQELLKPAGYDGELVTRRLARQTVAVIGLESAGSYVALELAKAGIGELHLYDPNPARPDDPGVPLDPAVLRASALAEHLASTYGTRVKVGPEADWSKDFIAELADSADFLVAAFDRDHAKIAHWVNRIALEKSKPAAFVSVAGSRGTAGPIVFPGETACFMCFRMRDLSGRQDFAAEMALEEERDRRTGPSAVREPTFPTLAPILGGLLASEIVKTMIPAGRQALVSRVMTWDAFDARLIEHDVLAHPNCPVCSKKNSNPPFPDLRDYNAEESGTGLAGQIGRLVGPGTGIVRSLDRFHKDPSEPEWPRIYRADLANFAFQEDLDESNATCSGKGETDIAARVSAIGEAVERYSGGIWPSATVPRSTRAALTTASVDPSRFILYTPEQYSSLPYQPYDHTSVLGWVEGRSMNENRVVSVPAMAALMNYSVTPGECQLFQITSNGLAAGPTLAQAALRATLELLERDAFISTWLLRLGATRIDPATHPAEGVRGIVEGYRRRGVEIELYRLTTDQPVTAFVALGVGAGPDVMPAMVVGMGADFSAARAARSAILEVGQVRPALRFRLRDPEIEKRRLSLIAEPLAVEKLEDHDLRYAGYETLDAFRFLRESPLGAEDWSEPPADTLAQLDVLAGWARERGDDLIFVNLTPPDMAALGLYTVRAIVPGLQPIYFGQKEARLALPRLRYLHLQFAAHSAFASFAINPDPHPVA